ncbi:MAG: acyloxyacyl hydrolase [Candidatus Omnitrophota bacterium]
MANERSKTIVAGVFLIMCFCCAQAYALNEQEDDVLIFSQRQQDMEPIEESEAPEKAGIGKWLQEAGFFTGYIRGNLKNQGDLEVIPTGLRFGFDLKPFVEKFGIHLNGMFEILYEPFINTIIGPRNNVELGCAFLFRYSYPLTSKFYPYIEVGSGLYYMTLATQEQSTQFNFIDQGGAGFSYFLREDLALNVGYRFRHVSNCSIKQPNSGINADVYLVGMSYYF